MTSIFKQSWLKKYQQLPEVESRDTRLEAKAKAKETKKIRGQGQPFRGQNLSRPRTKDTGASVPPKKKGLQKFFFRRYPIYWRTQNFDRGRPKAQII